jgi:hypothetical protein
MGKGIVKLGEGQWAVKDGNLLAAKETNGRFKNTEFTVSRGTRASYVGRDGLIKESNLQDVNLVNNGDFSELGSELVTNGAFDTDSDWSKGTGWSIANGVASSDGTQSSNTNLQSSTFDFSVDTKVTLSFDVVNYSSGNLAASVTGTGQADLTNINSNGTYSVTVVSSAGSRYVDFTADANFVGSIDNVSVKEVDPNDYWTLGTGWSIEDGVAASDGVSGNSNLVQENILTVGKTYKVSVDVTRNSGEVRFYITSDPTATITSSGTYTFYGVCDRTDLDLHIKSVYFDGTIDNISIQEVKTDTPRIDFTDNTDGHLLLEPQSTNLVTYSEDFSDSSWAKTNCTINSNNSISPEGTQNADKLDFTTSSGEIVRTTSFVSGQEYTMSFYAKTESGTLDFNYGNMDYTMNSGTATTEWQRFEITQTLPSATRFPKIQTTEIGSLLLWGFQIEQLSYPTSYIPTNGSTVTRDAETCTGAGSSADFNSEEGVLYAEIAALANDGTNRPISIGDGTTSNVVRFYYSVTDNRIVGNVKSGGSSVFNYNNVLSDATDFIKVAVSYKADDYKMYVNGINVSTDTSGAAPIGLTELAFDNGAGTDNFYGKCKAIKVYKEALSDTDLQNLTS